jgi:hypothetical protein
MKVGTLTPILLKWKSYENTMYANKLDNWNEMDKFLETYELPKLTYKEIANLYKFITSKELESVINTFLAQRSIHD